MGSMSTERASIRDWIVPANASEALFRGVIVANLILVAFSWWPWFEGTAEHVGEVDRLFGAFRLGGFRADLVWLIISNFFVFWHFSSFSWG
jgi:hypothetical protein